jgi:subtilisin family serine protease
LQRSLVIAASLTTAVVLVGCGGGGGTPPAQSGTPGPGPTMTSPPVSGPNTTVVSIQSVPAGLGVTIVNGSNTQSATTPTSTTPRVSNFQTAISIAPSNGGTTYTYSVDQHGAGNKTFLYNQAADTSGSIGSVSTSSAARSLDASGARRASVDAATLPHRFSRGAFGRPSVSSSRLVVRYRASALGVTGLARTHQIETAEGAAIGIDIGPRTSAVLTRILDVPTGRTMAEFASAMRSKPEVVSADPERLYYTENSAAFTPLDTHFDSTQQWSMFAIGAPNAWGYTHGSPGIAIAMIDTGVDFTHQDLAAPKITFAESILNGVKTAGTAAAQDNDGHGTNVAGIAAANTNNGFGYAGVGFDTSLQIYKVFSDGTAANKYATSANSGDVTQAIYDAVSHGARVINLSLGTCQVEGADPMQRDAVAYAISHNVSVVAAAGNERSGISGDANCAKGSSTVDLPAAYDGVIAVGASKLDDTQSPGVPSGLNTEAVASYSNSGPGLTLVAPGGDPTPADTAAGATTADFLHWIAGLYSTTAADPAVRCKNKEDCRALFAGTSQASPHAAGVVALMLAANPGLTPAQIKTILANTADDLGDPNQGAGRLDAYRALAVVTGDASPPTLPTNANFVAFAYVPNGTNTPQIIDVTFTTGVRVASNGTFRIADIPANASNYKIGIWYDANGDGKVDAGDYFGSSQTCSAAAACSSAAGITAHPVATGFVLN